MSKKIIITENQYSKLMGIINEQQDINPLFKTQYNAEDKSVLASYYLLDEKPNTYVVLNPKEYLNKSNVWADGADVYTLKFDIAQLPKAQVQIVGEVDSHPEYKIFKIPYWLFKKDPKLDIRRIEGFKRHSVPGNEEVYKKIAEMGIVDAFKALGGDFPKIQQTVDQILNPIKPKEVDPSVYRNKDITTPDFNRKTYWGD